ncbi:MAG TPA: ATP-dependent helicase, partial [Microbacterium sp.]|nr:ATP-dependent helicase [Microbacterium sp.]
TLRAAGTVEDHIATMQARKRGLADAALTGSDADLLTLGDDELYEVLRLNLGATP